MLMEGIILSIVIGFVRKGSLRNLERVDIKLWQFIFVGGFLQLLIRILMTLDNSLSVFLIETFTFWHFLTYIFLAVPLVFNLKHIWCKLLLLGTIMNMIPIVANGGRMPVKLPPAFAGWQLDNAHVLLTDSTHFKFLSDLFALQSPYPIAQVMSIGDLFLVTGAILFVQYAMVPPKPEDIENTEAA